MKSVLITAGPTREYIDPVRYISNDSSGLMGFALAKAAIKKNCKVTLISGPVALAAPKGVKRIDVVSASDMRQAVMKHSKSADIIFMAAAVADWRPRKYSNKKIKKRVGRMTLKLFKNPDILLELGKRKRKGQMLIGFALETENLKKNAQKKLAQKNCDWIVANYHTAIGRKKCSAILVSKKGRIFSLPKLPKDKLAGIILSRVLNKRDVPLLSLSL